MFRFLRNEPCSENVQNIKSVFAFFSTSVLSPVFKLSICRKECSQTLLELISEREKSRSLSCSDGRKKREPKTVGHVQDYCKLPSAFFLTPSPPSFSRLTSKLTKDKPKNHCHLIKLHISKNFL